MHRSSARPRRDELIVADPVILASAREHQISDDDMLHAYRNPIRVFDLDGLAMPIGPDTAKEVSWTSIGELLGTKS